MKKSIIMTIRPEHLVKILNGDKTIEIRKTIPKNIELPCDVYLVCSKEKPYLYTYSRIKENSDWEWEQVFFVSKEKNVVAEKLNGKVVCKFTLNKIGMVLFNLTHWRYEVDANGIDLSIASCVSTEDIRVYLGNEHRRKGNPKYQSNKGYAYHIDNLVIFNEPKELSEFEKEEYAVMPNGVFPCYQLLTKAPQSWQYCYVKGE